MDSYQEADLGECYEDLIVFVWECEKKYYGFPTYHYCSLPIDGVSYRCPTCGLHWGRHLFSEGFSSWFPD